MSFNFMAAVTICSDLDHCRSKENSLSLFSLFPHLFAMNNRNLPGVLEAGSPSSTGQQSQFLLWLLPWAFLWAQMAIFSQVSSRGLCCVHTSMPEFPFPVRTPVLLDEAHPNDFISPWLTSLKTHLQIQSHLRSLRVRTYPGMKLMGEKIRP